MKIQFTNTQKTYLKEIEEKLTTNTKALQFVHATSGIQQFWNLLQASEQLLIDKKLTNENSIGDVEYGFALYVLNTAVPKSLTTLLRTHYGMPVTYLDYGTFIKDFNLGGYITSNGSLVAISKYAVLDPGWFISLLQYLWYKYIHPSGKADFVEKSVIIPVSNTEVTIAVLGDWGTGDWKDGAEGKCPAQLVIDGIVQLQPDYIIHLGDVYYAGTKNEEIEKFIDLLPSKYKDRLFTLNSNHEMYDGANGYFNQALGNGLFKSQQGTSYFALEADNWVIVCLDSSYFDESPLYMKGALAFPDKKNVQTELLKSYADKGKQLILMTHHNGTSFDGAETNGLLWQQVTAALNGKTPDLWYWGHVHNGVVYNETCKVSANPDNRSINNQTPLFRCNGHAAIPFGNASALHNGKTTVPQVDYYANTPMDAPSPTLTQKLRTLNGFAMLTLSDAGFKEDFYEVSNSYSVPKKVWSVPKVR